MLLVAVALARDGIAGGARQPEIEHARATVPIDENIVGLEVAMDDPGGVRTGEPFACREKHAQDLTRPPRLLSQPRPNGDAVDELHREEHFVIEGADVIDG